MPNADAIVRRAPSQEADVSAEWTLADLLRVFARRRVWIVSGLVLCSALALADWIAATPRYRATAIIEVHKQSRGAFGLDNATADSPTTAVSDSFDDNLTLQTEVGILQSDAVVLDVIRRTGLEQTPDYFAQSGRPSWIAALRRKSFFWRRPAE